MLIAAEALPNAKRAFVSVVVDVNWPRVIADAPIIIKLQEEKWVKETATIAYKIDKIPISQRTLNID